MERISGLDVPQLITHACSSRSWYGPWSLLNSTVTVLLSTGKNTESDILASLGMHPCGLHYSTAHIHHLDGADAGNGHHRIWWYTYRAEDIGNGMEFDTLRDD